MFPPLGIAINTLPHKEKKKRCLLLQWYGDIAYIAKLVKFPGKFIRKAGCRKLLFLTPGSLLAISLFVAFPGSMFVLLNAIHSK